MIRRAAASAIACVLLLGMPARDAGAQTIPVPGCPPDSGIDARLAQAPVVFTGLVEAVTDDGREAYVKVIRVWKGGPLPQRVQVRGTVATQSKVVTALDRLYAKERAYLFGPTTGQSPRFVENQCSLTTPLTAELSAKAPPDGGAPPSANPGVDLPAAENGKFLPLLIGGVAAVLLVALFVLARRAQRRLREEATHGEADADPES
jgi:hypothetical protein